MAEEIGREIVRRTVPILAQCKIWENERGQRISDCTDAGHRVYDRRVYDCQAKQPSDEQLWADEQD